jgi:hypothetical protein
MQFEMPIVIFFTQEGDRGLLHTGGDARFALHTTVDFLKIKLRFSKPAQCSFADQIIYYSI